MDIDWFTFIAQIVNFLVLVVLLRWLLYERIVRAMKRREETIAGRLEDAQLSRAEADKEAAQYQEMTLEIDAKREAVFQEARRAAEQERERLLEEARKEVDQKREEWHETLRREQDDLVSDLRRNVGKASVEAARRTLAELADADLETRMCDSFATRLRKLARQQREEIAQHLKNGDAEASIRTAFDVPDERRARLRETIRETFGYDADVSFQRSADLVCGVELEVGGYSFGWNVKQFLHDLELEFEERLKSTS
jgi:F-type H+-transporting ATPase subunit b